IEDSVEISVADNGIGIEEDIREKIFQSFFTTKLDDRGTGLGLSVSKSIVSDHEGEIEVVSQKGCGSIFKVSLPIENNKVMEHKNVEDAHPWFTEEKTGQMEVGISD
ncbi:MAG: ATP-binding protein, partial [Patescibacteria group bacterium]